jgi:hypothetical protein
LCSSRHITFCTPCLEPVHATPCPRSTNRSNALICLFDVFYARYPACKGERRE